MESRIEKRLREEELRQQKVDEESKADMEKAVRAADQIIPAAGRLLVRAELSANPSSHLHTPESARNMSLMGVIVCAGADCTYEKGQRIILGAFTGVKFEINRVPHLICTNQEIQGLIVGDEIQALAVEA